MILSKTKIQNILVLLIICISANSWAQQPGSSLAQQFNEVVTKASSYQGHKEIKDVKLQALWRNVTDSLQREKQFLNESKAKIVQNSQSIAGLKAELKQQKESLAEARSAVDEVSLVGIAVNKSTYNVLMWGLVFLLSGALAFAFWKAKSSVNEAAYRRGLFNDLSAEFQEHKVKAIEKEKKLARELQTERNRIAELSGHVR